jgi:hypothetical protein
MAIGAASSRDAVVASVAGSGLQKATRAHPAQERRHLLIVGGVLAVVVICCILAGMAAQFAGAARSSTLPIETAVVGSDHRSARVITDLLDDEKCRLRLYDNRTGNLAAPDQPCRNMVEFDNSGLQAPAATIRRLDGISKWFSSR